FHAAENLAAGQRDDPCVEARRYRSAWLQDRLDEMNSRETSTDASQFRPDALSQVAELMALHALRLFLIEEKFASTIGIAGTRQSGERQLFVFRLFALATEAHVKLDDVFGGCKNNQQ